MVAGGRWCCASWRASVWRAMRAVHFATPAWRTPADAGRSQSKGESSGHLLDDLVAGYRATIRPPESYTERLKFRQLNSGSNLHGDVRAPHYEEDRLMPLELGGSPTSVKNLWPEPRDTTWSASRKDVLESTLQPGPCARTPCRSRAHGASLRPIALSATSVTSRVRPTGPSRSRRPASRRCPRRCAGPERRDSTARRGTPRCNRCPRRSG